MNPNDYFYDKDAELYVNKKSSSVDYRDGSEQYLTDLFNNLKDHDMVLLQTFIKDWPTRYHLSNQRVNILEALESLFNKSWRVLELGAGTGALTYWLCERFRSIDIVEGALMRAKTLRARTRSFKNLRIFVDDIVKTDFKEQYDLVTLVGVLEYVPMYSLSGNITDDCVSLLKKISTHLTKEGIFLLAIENKLGAKYLSGCIEDHNGIPFSGIMDYYPKRSAITFSRNELEDMLKGAGFTNIQFYHGFPDYKLLTTMIKEDDSIYNVDISGFFLDLFQNYGTSRQYVFHDTLFIGSLLRARLLHHFSNSFIILCSKDNAVNIRTPWLVRKFWNSGKINPAYHHTTSLIEQDHKYSIIRAPLTQKELNYNSDNIQFQLSPQEEFVNGTSLMYDAYKKALRYKKCNDLTELLKEVLDNLIAGYSVGSQDKAGYELIKGDAIDYCLWNLIRSKDGKIHFIDKKWRLTDNIPVDYVLLRSLLRLFFNIEPFIKDIKVVKFVVPIMKSFFPHYDRKRFERGILREREFQKIIEAPIPKLLNAANKKLRSGIFKKIFHRSILENAHMLKNK